MKIACFDQEIKKVFETNYYKIPRFQRAYSWEKENITDFWSDIKTNSNGNYFLGSMVVYISKDYRYIVDGQQRLTTITILLAVLRDKFIEINFENQAKGIQKLIERKDLDDEDQFVIQTATSYPFFQQNIQDYKKPKGNIAPGEEEQLLADAYILLSELVNSTIDVIEKPLNKKKHLEKYPY